MSASAAEWSHADDLHVLLRHLDGTVHLSVDAAVAVCDRLAAHVGLRPSATIFPFDRGTLRAAFDALEEAGWEAAPPCAVCGRHVVDGECACSSDATDDDGRPVVDLPTGGAL